MSKTKYSLVFFFVICLMGLLLYYPILGNNFLSDDYDSLYRICIEDTIIVKEFLRPVIDISFKFNYFLGGLNSTGYYILNFLIHLANVFLIYKIAIALKPVNDQRLQVFGWLSALLFLIYPFHNEGIVWLTGRLSSISCFFALLSILIWLSQIKLAAKIILGLCFYFTGLLAYESILLLPFIVLLFMWVKTYNYRKAFLLMGGCFAIIITYLLIRFYVSGNIYGDYGSRMTDDNPLITVIKGAKTIGRLFLPPSEDSKLLVVLFIMLLIGFTILHIWIYKKYTVNILLPYTKLIAGLGLSMIIPILFGISTRTSESDRLLYFPSAFLCMIFSFIILRFISTTKMRIAACLLLSIYFVVFLILNNKNWEKASVAADKILTAAMGTDGKNIVYINLPDEIEGAFVFRNGFIKAMLLHNIDTGKISVNNYLTRLEYISFKKEIQVSETNDGLFLPPVTRISFYANDSVRIENLSDFSTRALSKQNTTILYWNKFDLVRLF